MEINTESDPALHNRLGHQAREAGDLDQAATHFAAALAIAPADGALHNNLGDVRRSQRRLAEATALFQRARALAPEAGIIAANLGSILLALHRPDLALPHLEYAAETDPAWLQVQGERAVCLCSLNRYAEALPVYQTMYETNPSCNDARYLEALALLALGDFENGWRKHETRWHAELGQGLRRHLPGAYWHGQFDLTGHTILVHAEQGHGDTIQYLRYVPMLTAGKVVLEVQPALKALLPGSYARGETLPPYSAQCSFMSLPYAFRTMPSAVPYLIAPPDRVEAWRRRLGPPDGRRRIAIAWTGASAVWNRSIPLPLLAPLLNRPDCAFHVVQTDMEQDDRETLSQMRGLYDHSLALNDFADSAAVVSLMDMVITVDTALCHLAGAMGKPVWTMLPFGAEYRWRTEGTASAWYPTMRLFRQPALNDWQTVVSAVQDAL